jgi:hypothetical protein
MASRSNLRRVDDQIGPGLMVLAAASAKMEVPGTGDGDYGDPDHSAGDGCRSAAASADVSASTCTGLARGKVLVDQLKRGLQRRLPFRYSFVVVRLGCIPVENAGEIHPCPVKSHSAGIAAYVKAREIGIAGFREATHAQRDRLEHAVSEREDTTKLVGRFRVLEVPIRKCGRIKFDEVGRRSCHGLYAI